MPSTATPAGVSKKLVASTAVEVSIASTLTPSGVSFKELVVSTPVEVSSTGGVGGTGADGVGLDLQKKLLAPRALKTRPRVEQ